MGFPNLFVTACNTKEIPPQNQAAFSEVYFDNLIKFHIDRQLKNVVFVLTAHKNPCHGHFEYIFLSQSDELHMAIDYSQINSAGYEHGGITPDEKETVLSILNALARTNNRMGSGSENEHVITICYSTPMDGVLVISCQSSNCPFSICKIYEIADKIASRNDNSYPAQLVCPIEDTNK